MKSFDFEYDGVRLSDIGYTVCTFGSDGMQTISNGSEITFNTVSTLNGAKYEFISSQYNTCLTSTFGICAQDCNRSIMEGLSVSEVRKIMRWLNRRTFHKFRLTDDDWVGMYAMGSFNVNRVEIEGVIIGLELTLITDRPFLLMEDTYIKIENTEEDGTYTIRDFSDEEGFIYPKTTITINQSGDLNIHNSIEDRDTYIANCEQGEVITMDSPVLTTSQSSHAIQNDFNWNFFRIANKLHDRDNILTISLPCTIELNYSPVAKMGLI